MEGETSAGYSWGNDHALACLSAANDLLESAQVGATGGLVVLAGVSMGAVLALNWALRHRHHVAAVLLGCPVLDLEELYRGDRGGLSRTVAAAYGVPPGHALPGLDDHDPWRYAPVLGGLPIRIYASADDPVASDTDACRRWAEIVGGDAVSVVDLGPAGHSPRLTPVDDAVAFAARFT